jgi:hypothetical protein
MRSGDLPVGVLADAVALAFPTPERLPARDVSWLLSFRAALPQQQARAAPLNPVQLVDDVRVGDPILQRADRGQGMDARSRTSQLVS